MRGTRCSLSSPLSQICFISSAIVSYNIVGILYLAYKFSVIILYVQNTTNGSDITTTYMLGRNEQKIKVDM